ncbi:L-threonine 3-dehydrogenase [Symbiodinium microadriaticum]|uniref:L-threonine 3-dehydrogenase n=1 Tax=Symbiodinium microadriaticum TaxID=2951 RepID=A0A1Q9DEE2_SYMMI|nr:L-threonine 3-dehydrogenase [Symbiodinium microadriaticum]CAE7207669.1 tdh [Symbiodinium microadriaticum]CAE7232003.1 tdh [Symbiodinium sp. KB8]
MRRLRTRAWLNAKPKPCASAHGPRRRMFASDSWQMILDMDGVLYKNAEVENEIVKRLGKATEKLGLGPDAHQELFRSHGSTLRGLLSEGHLSGEAIAAFYSSVYDGVDLQAIQPDPLLALQLKSLRAHGVSLWLATNSPRSFVDRVLEALGLESDLLHIICPSPENHWINKPDARFFEMLPRARAKFFDDSLGHVRAAVASGLLSAHVRRSDDIMMLVADALMVVPASWRLSKSHYLQAKEVADLRALSASVRAQLATELAGYAGQQISILDLGAGTLSMLSVILQALPKGCQVKYTALDRDEELLKQAAAERLESQFAATPHGVLPNTWQLPNCQVTVTLQAGDAVNSLETMPQQTLIVGCSILDLVDVQALSGALRQHQAGALLYFPIHYAGVTLLESPRHGDMELLTADYNRSLECRGQVTNVTNFYDSLGETIAKGPSSWLLDSKACPALFKQLVSFMAVNALGFHGHAAVGEAVAALQRSAGPGDLAEDVVLKVENVDYLGRVPGSLRAAPRRRLAVEFAAPGEARLVEETFGQPGEGEVLVQASYSAISAGTERRMLMQGPGTEPLDVTHELGETAWPFRYGYCMVGSVVQSNAADLLPGTRAFCFHPHASHAIVPSSAAQKIPTDVSDEDAVFFANMETACALSQDGAPVIGESVAVFGAGTVGALTAAVLAHHGYPVTVFDPRADRLAALQRRFPKISCGTGADFDVCIEASGSQDALASALQRCRRGGTVVIGSLYGESPVGLPLGLRFHRSEVSLKASQVSRIPADLSTRWTKARRSDLTWSLIRELRPKDWISSRFVPITAATDVYRELIKPGEDTRSDGRPLQWIFTYDTGSG